MTTATQTQAEKLSIEIQSLIDSGKYYKAARLAKDTLGIKLTVVSTEYRKYFPNDKQARHVFKMRMQRGRNSYTFEFGQSINAGAEVPTMYDVLTCMTKHDPDTFENFCSEFGYDTDSRTAEKTYKAVCKEFAAMQRMFSSEELEALSYIQ